ncbi:MAG: hypothetical protein P4M11_09040 [Candidatus Pacebacteria bacterium]|nr:hypothetical protein [Candidatus Paceibacterota bacterium]
MNGKRWTSPTASPAPSTIRIHSRRIDRTRPAPRQLRVILLNAGKIRVDPLQSQVFQRPPSVRSSLSMTPKNVRLPAIPRMVRAVPS